MTTPSRSTSLLLAVCLLFLGSTPHPLSAQGGGAPLFSDATAPPGLARAAHVAATRSRVVRVDTGVLARETHVILNLFDDVRLVARRTSLENPRHGSQIWRGQVEGLESGQATFAIVNRTMAGTVFVDGRTFEIGAIGELHEIRELDPSAFPTDDPPLDDPDVEPSVDTGVPATAAETVSQIDVLVVWTPNARRAAGGTASAVQSLIDLAVANANNAYANSRVPARLHLVYSGEVAFTESTSNIQGDLSALASPTDNRIDEVHGLRRQHGADVVTLLGSGYTSGGACGVGYLMGSPSTSFAPYAFNVVDQACAAGNLTYAHEVGHNQGLHHDPANAGSTPAYPYAYGYQDPGGAFRTVLSYGGAPRIQYLSSPNVSYNGRVTGTSSQDNARALTSTAPVVAAFQPSASASCTYSVAPASLSFEEGGGAASVTITTEAGCAWTASSNAGWLVVGSSSGSGSATLTATAAPNTGGTRTATLTVAGQSVAVSQGQAASSACAFAVSPMSLSVSSTGGTYAIQVDTAAGCTWTTRSNTGWLRISGSGSGAGTATLQVSSTNGGGRTGSVAVAGQTVTVTQAGATKKK
jgi:peptidyl-Asp metalloendopeptidase